METSGTFISDLKVDVLKEDYFTGMIPLSQAEPETGDMMLAVGDALLDYLIAHVDHVGITDRQVMIKAICGKHALIMAGFVLLIMHS